MDKTIGVTAVRKLFVTLYYEIFRKGDMAVNNISGFAILSIYKHAPDKS